MRRSISFVLALCLALPLVPSASGFADDSAAELAAKEIADARDRANAANEAYFTAESRIDQLSVDRVQLEGEVTQLQAQVDELRQAVENVAIDRYTRSGTGALPVLSGFQAPEDQVQLDALIDVINDTSATSFDQYDSLAKQLVAKKSKLAATKTQAEQAKGNLAGLRDAATAEVEHLKVVEANRLKDDAVRNAVAAEQAARARAVDAKRQAQQTAIALPAATPAGGAPAAAAPVAATPKVAPAGKTDSNPGGDATGGQAGGDIAPASPFPLGGVYQDFGGSGFVCPTGTAPVSFSDTWGAPRSGGRRHEGVDLIGDRGTPILAVVDGDVLDKTNSLGGNAIWLTGSDGNKYYYAHLDSWAASGSVTAGTVIGYMGDTGNARFSVVHLHFEVHPGGGPAVNPYPTARAHC